MRKYTKILIISFLFLFKASFVHAELVGDLILSPENPGPYQSITVTLNSYDFDVDSANISWSVNGKSSSGGPGVKQFTFTTGAVGTFTNIASVARLPNGQTFQASMTITPASVDLVWESPESFVPPFYEGRSLPAEGASVRFNATPHMSSGGKILSPLDVSYAWYKNEEFMESASGRGKQSADINLEYLTDVTKIKVMARSPDGATAVKSVDVYSHNMVPIFYVHDPVLGTDLSTAISRRFETTKEFTLKLMPYFFSLNNGVGGGATFAWTLDGAPITTTDDTTITLRPKENSYGSKLLGVSFENSNRILQNAETSLNIVFDTRTQ